ncbi:SH3 domain-containing protein [Xenorhabdus szentirmaii]|uniref:Variant SH3 domain protein n=3 Tax=Xenorhabdus szentirmaii TaxID=290112 RepID=W1IZM6_9GAMM|nr:MULTISPECIES: SH3 domain-containing protein [Xenorhabdus]MBD2793539.1 SH3 domain-containing protein [Xenorhabdus sp. CUL]MBD2799106.1 SH3 domain-containing protein [Xenorhabdus sp. M]MBD2806127.1 SH3 domain-containing protein [Xenorhabdus sp. ZM]MBD2822184.1 SH3 domain-containing protein [Xenorhabdus sp. 42]MBD2825502.1 SH3 domain-containing protein [Xenorhabdus sp. 5]
MLKKSTVIRDHVSTFSHPIVLKAGDIVSVSHSDIKYPCWVWVINALQINGWVPQQILHFIFPDKAICAEDYTSHELTVSSGECLYLERLLNGWYWAHKKSGETGWIPKENVIF